MKFQVNERVTTDLPYHELTEIISDQFKMIASSVKQDNRIIVVKGVEETFGSVHRADRSEVEVRSKKGSKSRLIVVTTNYRPSVMFWIITLILLPTVILWILPVVFYLNQKKTVQESITNCLRNIKQSVTADPVLCG